MLRKLDVQYHCNCENSLVNLWDRGFGKRVSATCGVVIVLLALCTGISFASENLYIEQALTLTIPEPSGISDSSTIHLLVPMHSQKPQLASEYVSFLDEVHAYLKAKLLPTGEQLALKFTVSTKQPIRNGIFVTGHLEGLNLSRLTHQPLTSVSEISVAKSVFSVPTTLQPSLGWSKLKQIKESEQIPRNGGYWRLSSANGAIQVGFPVRS